MRRYGPVLAFFLVFNTRAELHPLSTAQGDGAVSDANRNGVSDPVSGDYPGVCHPDGDGKGRLLDSGLNIVEINAPSFRRVRKMLSIR
jgi:hypothetical protein